MLLSFVYVYATLSLVETTLSRHECLQNIVSKTKSEVSGACQVHV